MLGIWWLIAATLIGGMLIIRIWGEITKEKLSKIKEEQSKEKGKGLYIRIKEKQPDTVTLSMFDKNGNHVQDAKVTSVWDYVDERIKVGDTIY